MKSPQMNSPSRKDHKEHYEDYLTDQIKMQLASKHLDNVQKTNNLGNYIVGKTLGQGSMGRVKLATHKQSGQLVAIKIIKKSLITNEVLCDKVQREIEILKILRHPNLIQLYEIFETPTQILMVTEYCENGELYDLIINKGKIYEFDAAKIFWQILSGVEYLHNCQIAHRDIKAENIAMSNKGIPKLIDFSLSNFQKQGVDLLKTPCGSPEYASPEMIQGKKYNGFFSDMWSCGVLLFSMVSGYLPFESDNQQQLYEQIIKGIVHIPDFLTKECGEIILLLLNLDPTVRPKIPQLRKHSWFKKNKVYTLEFIYTEQIKLHIPQGFHVGQHIVPIDNYLIKQTEKFGFKQEAKFSIEHNNHTQESGAYYLFLHQHVISGGKSPADISSENFKPKLIYEAPAKNTLLIPVDKKTQIQQKFTSSKRIRDTQTLIQSNMNVLSSLNIPQNQSTINSQQEKGISSYSSPLQLLNLTSIKVIQEEQPTTLVNQVPFTSTNIQLLSNSKKNIVKNEVVTSLSINEMKTQKLIEGPFPLSPNQKKTSIQKIIPDKGNVLMQDSESSSSSDSTSKSGTERDKQNKELQKKLQNKKRKDEQRKLQNELLNQEQDLKDERQKQIELFYRHPQGLRKINKAQAKRYIIKSPYKVFYVNYQQPNLDQNKTFHLMFPASSTIDQLVYDSEKNSEVKKIYNNVNYQRVEQVKKKTRFFSVDSRTDEHKLSQLNQSLPVKRQRKQSPQLFSKTRVDFSKNEDNKMDEIMLGHTKIYKSQNSQEAPSGAESGSKSESGQDSDHEVDQEAEIKVTLEQPPILQEIKIKKVTKGKKRIKQKKYQTVLLPKIEARDSKLSARDSKLSARGSKQSSQTTNVNQTID